MHPHPTLLSPQYSTIPATHTTCTHLTNSRPATTNTNRSNTTQLITSTHTHTHPQVPIVCLEKHHTDSLRQSRTATRATTLPLRADTYHHRLIRTTSIRRQTSLPRIVPTPLTVARTRKIREALRCSTTKWVGTEAGDRCYPVATRITDLPITPLVETGPTCSQVPELPACMEESERGHTRKTYWIGFRAAKVLQNSIATRNSVRLPPAATRSLVVAPATSTGPSSSRHRPVFQTRRHGSWTRCSATPTLI